MFVVSKKRLAIYTPYCAFYLQNCVLYFRTTYTTGGLGFQKSGFGLLKYLRVECSTIA